MCENRYLCYTGSTTAVWFYIVNLCVALYTGGGLACRDHIAAYDVGV
jgi:hypothetical protein